MTRLIITVFILRARRDQAHVNFLLMGIIVLKLLLLPIFLILTRSWWFNHTEALHLFVLCNILNWSFCFSFRVPERVEIILSLLGRWWRLHNVNIDAYRGWLHSAFDLGLSSGSLECHVVQCLDRRRVAGPRRAVPAHDLTCVQQLMQVRVVTCRLLDRMSVLDELHALLNLFDSDDIIDGCWSLLRDWRLGLFGGESVRNLVGLHNIWLLNWGAYRLLLRPC